MVSFFDYAEKLPGALNDLQRHLAGQGRELVVLIDEIQTPFVKGRDHEFYSDKNAAVIACLKKIVGTCRTVFTGSGMVTATLQMSLAKPSGFRLLGVTKQVFMGEPHPVPARLLEMATAIAEAYGFLPLPGGFSIEQVIEAMKTKPEFAGRDLDQPLRLAMVVAALNDMRASPTPIDTLAVHLSSFAMLKLLDEAQMDLSKALQYRGRTAGVGFNSDTNTEESLELFASLAYGRCTWARLMVSANIFVKAMKQLCVPCSNIGAVVKLMAPYDSIIKRLIAPRGQIINTPGGNMCVNS